MLGRHRLAVFSFRALVLVLLTSILWANVAGRYNEVLVSLAQPFVPDGTLVKAAGSHIIVEGGSISPLFSIDALTLHSGLLLMVVLILAAVGIGTVPRLAWLLVMGAGAIALNVIGVMLLARGIVWAFEPASTADPSRLVFSLFAVFWGLLPALAAGLWCWLYWVPRVSHVAPEVRRGADTAEAPRL